MSQFLRPNSDTTLTEIGSASPAYTSLDEASPSDADFAWSNDNTTARLEVGLTDPSGTPASGNITIRYRIARTNDGVVDGAGSASTVIARLIEGTTVLSSDAQRTATGTWTQYSWTVSTSVVTDWTNLRVRFDITGGGGNPSSRRGMGVSWTEVEVPDAAVTNSGSFTADAVISKVTASSFTADALVKRVYVGSSDSNQQTTHNFNANTEGFVSDDGGVWNSGSAALNWNATASAGQTDTNHWTRTFTWQDLGVPAGAIVVGFQLDNISTRWSVGTGSGYTVNPDKVDLLDNSNGLIAALLASRTTTTTEASFTGRTSQYVALDGRPSSETVKLQITQQVTAGGGGTTAGGITTDVVYYTVYWTVPFSFTADAEISEAAGSTVTGSFTADAHISATVAGSFAANAHISKADIASSFTADAFIKRVDQPGSFTADAFIRRTFEATFIADAFVKRVDLTGSFTADAYVCKLDIPGSFTADANISKGGTGSFTADAYVRRTFGQGFTADAHIWKVQSGSFTADAYLRRTFSATFTADAFVRATVSGSFVADAFVLRTFGANFTADAYVSQLVTGSFTANAEIAPPEPGERLGSFTADAFILRVGLNGSFTADAFIARTTSDSFVADAFIRRTFEQSFVADAFIRVSQTGSFVADAFVRRTLTGLFVADAHIAATVLSSITLDAYIYNPNATQNITGSTSVSAHGRFGASKASSWASGIRVCPTCGKRHTTASRGLSGTTTVSSGD